MNIIDQYLGGFPWLVIGVIELFCIGWVYGTLSANPSFIRRLSMPCVLVGVDNFCDDIALMLGESHRPGKFWRICWQYISPLILVVIIILCIC